jgi:hypothetical protein
MMARYGTWPISERAKIALHAVDNDSFRKESAAQLRAMVIDCRKTDWANDTHRFALTQAIAALEGELAARSANRVNRWIIGIGVATLAAAVLTLVATVRHW